MLKAENSSIFQIHLKSTIYNKKILEKFTCSEVDQQKTAEIINRNMGTKLPNGRSVRLSQILLLSRCHQVKTDKRYPTQKFWPPVDFKNLPSMSLISILDKLRLFLLDAKI